MSACDTCPVPGHCCRQIYLGHSTLDEAETIEEAALALSKMKHRKDSCLVQVMDEPVEDQFPFRPLYRVREGYWKWWCPNLDLKTGRCLDYDNRPGLCRDYQPKQDRLCILYEAEDGQHS